MPFFNTAERPLYYEESGQGPTVVFCHGAGSNAATWWQQLPGFRRHFHCVAIDVRCFGRSPAPVQEFTLPHFVADVVALLNHLRVERAAFIGQSLGGMIGLRAALWHPDRISALVPTGSSLAIDHPVLRDCVERHLGKVPVVAIEERALSPRFTTGHPELAALYGQLNRFNPSSLSIPREAWGAAMRALNQTDTLLPTAALGGLRCPTLFVVGSEDPIVPVEVVRELSGLVPGGELFVIEGAAHSAYYEQPQAFNPRVLAFLREALGGEPARPPGH